MFALNHTDTPMHRIRLEVPCDCGLISENVYERFTLRRYFIGRVPVWCRDINVERHPMHEFLRSVF